MTRFCGGKRWAATLAASVLAAASPALGYFDMYGGGPTPQPRTQPAIRAEDFVEAIGLSADPNPNLFDLGIRYYRVAVWDTRKGREQLPQRIEGYVKAWNEHGVRPMVLLDSLRDKPDGTMVMIKQYPPGLIADIEGPNEVNNKFDSDLNSKYDGKIDEAAGGKFMTDLVTLLEADEQTKDIPVIAFTAIFSDYSEAKPNTAFDFGNMHSYQGSGVPEASLEMNETRFNNILPVGGTIKPFVPTECGYNVEADIANGTGLTGSLSAQAKSIPMLLVEYMRHGFPRTYLFAMHNADGYGLLESDNKTKRPSYFAVQNLMGALIEAKWNPQTMKWEGGRDFAPKALMFDLPGAPDLVHTLVTQKSTGEYNVLIWNELENYDSGAKADRNNPAAEVTMAIQTPVKPTATILTPNAEGKYDQSEAKVVDGKLQLKVPSTVMIVRLTPADGDGLGKVIAGVDAGGIESKASESDVTLAWKPVDAAAGYFVYRNGWHIATVTDGTSYHDVSSYLRPGLGYPYSIQAYDANGNMAPKTEVVVQTAAKFPDLIVTDFGMENPDVKPGEKVRFYAKMKNIGQGATPPTVQDGVTWSVDGKVVGWCTKPGPMKPGEEWNLVADGGPADGGQWTAVAGAHVLRCYIDDINRLPGENKGNNVTDKTITVGEVAAGVVQGMAEAAPGAVDLTAEGTLDWVHWGVGGKDGVNRKAGGANLIGERTKTGEGYLDATSGCPVGLSYTDGTDPKETSNNHYGLWWNNVGTASVFSVPADTTERVLRVYVAGIEGARCKFTAKLSDDSAPAYVSESMDGNRGNGNWAAVPGAFSAVYTVRYKAAGDGQKLMVECRLDNEPNRFRGQVRLQAATLSDK